MEIKVVAVPLNYLVLNYFFWIILGLFWIIYCRLFFAVFAVFFAVYAAAVCAPPVLPVLSVRRLLFCRLGGVEAMEAADKKLQAFMIVNRCCYESCQSKITKQQSFLGKINLQKKKIPLK